MTKSVEPITGIDIGSTAVRVVVGEPTDTDEVRIIGVAEGPSEGVQRGVITSIEDTVSSVSSVLEKVERMTGLPVNHAVVGMGGHHVMSEVSRGVVAVSRADGEIQADDVERVIEAAQAVATPPNYEILHVLPRTFSVDSQVGIRDPVGMVGIRLEVEAEIIEGISTHLKNLTKCIHRAGVQIDDVVASILAASAAVLSRRQKELGVALVDIGGTTTSVAIYEEGDLLATRVFPVGARHITSDVAIGLRTSIDVAEKIKVEYGSCLSDLISRHDEFDLETVGSAEAGRVSRKQVAEIIQARCEEIFQMVNEELTAHGRAGKLPAGIVLVGGGAKLEGLVACAKEHCKLPAAIGVPNQVAATVDRIEDPAFAVAAGLVKWGFDDWLQAPRSNFGILSAKEIRGKMQDFFRQWLP